MAKKRKNSNYVTEKTELAKAKKLAEARKRKNKKIIITVLIALAVLAVIAGIVLAIGFGFGLFEYTPEVTYHASIEIKDYGTLHVELYGKEAPQTVDNFVRLANSGYFNGMSFHKIVDDLIYGGSVAANGGVSGIKGEFSANNVENKISHTRGTISMARGEGMNSGYAQFFVVRKTDRSLDGNYAAFGRITSGMDIIDKIFEDASVNAAGNINTEDFRLKFFRLPA